MPISVLMDSLVDPLNSILEPHCAWMWVWVCCPYHCILFSRVAQEGQRINTNHLHPEGTNNTLEVFPADNYVQWPDAQ